jgi:hypothetical protein
MNVATHVRAQPACVGDLLGEQFVATLDRLRLWKSEDGGGRSDWRARFLDWQEATPEGRTTCARVAEAEARLDESDSARVRKRMYGLFRLDAAERALCDAALALAADPAIANLIASIDGFRHGRLTERLVIEAMALPTRPILRPASPLALWGLVEGSGEGLTIDPDIAAIVAGRPGLDRRLAPCAEVIEPRELGIRGWPVERTVGEIARLNEMRRAVRVVLAAPPGSGRLHFATMVAEALSTRVIRVIPGADADEDLAMRAQRLALLTGHALYWDGTPPSAPPTLAAAPVQFAAVLPFAPPPPADNQVDIHVDLPPLSPDDKRAVWSAAAGGAAEIEIDRLGRLLAGARLADLIAVAEHAPATLDAAHALFTRRVRARVAGGGNLLGLPFVMDDLALSAATAAQLRTILAELRGRERLLADPAVRAHYGRLGESMLFHGPPGTGKTMAAQVIARELGVDLVRIDCATILSKFIGETIKQLRDVFARVEGTGTVLLFDEADALFARRTEVKDAHDRHANADTNYLLQLIEGFGGVAILATNRRENIEPAFLRRLRHAVEFGDAGLQTRARLWAGHIAALGGGSVDRDRTAGWAGRLAAVELTPAQIKGAALTSLFARDAAARELPEIGDFVLGIERELAKDGRALDRQLRARMTADG